MEELLLPSGEEEARSEHSSFVPGDEGKTMWDRFKASLQVTVNGSTSRNIRSFCKRNGLLTLSVIAVLTGCTLGFMLRGTQLSTQVRLIFQLRFNFPSSIPIHSLALSPTQGPFCSRWLQVSMLILSFKFPLMFPCWYFFSSWYFPLNFQLTLPFNLPLTD